MSNPRASDESIGQSDAAAVRASLEASIKELLQEFIESFPEVQKGESVPVESRAGSGKILDLTNGINPLYNKSYTGPKNLEQQPNSDSVIQNAQAAIGLEPVLQRIKFWTQMARLVDVCLHETVDEARQAEVTWEAIGEAAELSRSAAYRKFDERGRAQHQEARRVKKTSS